MEVIKELFADNINVYFLVLFIVTYIFLSKIELDRNNLKIKVSIIYIFLYIIVICNIINILEIIFLTIFMTFIFLEFITNDKLFIRTVKKPVYFLYDYLYKILFEYKILYFIISVSLLSKLCETHFRYLYLKFNLNYYFCNIEPYYNNIYSIITIILSLIFLIYGIIKVVNEEFETLNFTQIKTEMEKIMPFWKFSSNNKLYDFAKLLTNKEDKSFFKRDNSYNWISIEFVFYRLQRVYDFCKIYGLSKTKYIGRPFHIIICIIYIILNAFILLTKNIIKFIKVSIKILFKKSSISNYFRGYSTIEMQLVRTIAVKSGYSNVIRRKVYELIYSQIYFDSLNRNYKYYIYSNIEDYRFYLIYLYIRVARVNINGIIYDTILNMYNKEKINDIEIEEFYVWTLGLSHRKIDIDLLDCDTVKIFKMRKKVLKKLIKRYES